MNAKEKTKKHFNETAAYYNDSGDGRFVAEMYGVMVREILKSETGKILDVGCGNGNLFTMLPNDKYELYGIDFSENMILEAKNNCMGKATFTVADVECMPFEDETFDIVVCNASFHHYIHPDASLKEMNRVLKDGGKLLIGDPYVPRLVRPMINVLAKFSDEGDYHFYGIGEMEKLFLKNGFEPVESYRTGHRTAFHMASK
ncbi:class I SAM-dependent methyltransferase [Methanobrevibacter sp.]